MRKEIMDVCFIWCLLIVGCLPLVTSSSTACDTQNFPCDSGDQCVGKNKWCDGKENCVDGSDEKYCSKRGWFVGVDPNDCEKKKETHILCGSGICIPIAAKCDEQKDCDDGFDEEHCEPTENSLNTMTTEETKDSTLVVDVLPSTLEANYVSEVDQTVFPISPSETSSTALAETRHYEADKELTTPAISAMQEVHSSVIDNYLPKSTSYYDKRMKEAVSEIKPPLTFPKTVPTKPYIETRTRISTTPKTPRRNFTRPTYSTTYQSIPKRSPPISTNQPQSRQPTKQRQITNQRAHHYLPSINHYQLPTNQYQPLSHRYQDPSNRYPPPSNNYQPYSNYRPPSNNYQPHSNHYRYQPLSNQYQPPSTQYQSPYDQYQPPSNQYQPRSNQYQPPSNQYQPPSNQYQPPSNQYQHHNNPYQQHSNRYQRHREHQQSTNNNERRPLNGEPDVRHQTNYFKTYGAVPSAKKFFYFSKDYAAIYGRDNARLVHEGVEWLLRQRTDTQDWGRDTSRAVIALALANNSFLNDSNEDQIIKNQFMVQFGTDLLRNNTENFNINRLVMAINGLMAVCEDPTDFHGMDLTEVLRHKIREDVRKKSYLNPFVYLSLCLANKSLSSSEVKTLVDRITRSVNADERTKDMKIAALMALSCHVHHSVRENDSYYRNILRVAVADLLEQMGKDGNFGSVYSTALAAQALMSTNESSNWDADKTMNFLKQQQRENGSFGDFLASYLVLPALSGRSLLHLRNRPCNPVKRELTAAEILEMAGPKQYVFYSLYFGYPIVNSFSQYLQVPRGINFLDVMRVAEYLDQNFRFTLDDDYKVYSLSGLPNDPEMGLSWHLYLKPGSSPYPHEPNARDRFSGDVRTLLPNTGEYWIFWYHSNDVRI